MPGPLPKDPKKRQHRIKRSTRAVLPVEDSPIKRRPNLPDHPEEEEWHPMAERFWRDIWNSPMSEEYLRADAHGLFITLVLVDQFWKKPSVNLSREIRLRGQLFGLTPIDRRRLEWSVAQTEEAKDKYEMKRSRRAVPIDNDPRDVLGD